MNKANRREQFLKGKQILVVDDDPLQVMVVAQMITQTGCRVIKSNDPGDVLDILKRNQIDLVILDVMMPSPDGWEVFNQIRKMPRHREMPVIFLTALVGSGEEGHFNQKKDRCRVLAKPATHDSLLSAIKELLMA